MMDSTTISDLQETLSLSLSAVSLQKELDDNDSISSASSSSTSPSTREHHRQYPPRGDSNGITLDLYHWARYSQYQPASDEEGRQRAVNIFQYFANVATSFGMKDLTCVSLIQEALDVCTQGITAGQNVSRAPRIALKCLKDSPRLDYERVGVLLNNIPIFNVLEAICWVYTSCVDSDAIRSDRQAELYLYQLYLIFKALKNTRWVTSRIMPSTIAAAWSKPDGLDSPLLVAFACAGVGKDLLLRREISTARCDFIKRLHNVSKFGHNKEQGNAPGNCPEFLLWGTVCEKGVSYRSLCLNLNQPKSYMCCDHCQLVARSAEQHIQIHIEDWYHKTSLVPADADVVRSNGFDSCDLKTLGEILMEVRKATRKAKKVSTERNLIASGRKVGGNVA